MQLMQYFDILVLIFLFELCLIVFFLEGIKANIMFFSLLELDPIPKEQQSYEYIAL